MPSSLERTAPSDIFEYNNTILTLLKFSLIEKNQRLMDSFLKIIRKFNICLIHNLKYLREHSLIKFGYAF